jgi:hypothetical protein
MNAVLERESETRSEWNHSCTSQCPNPCPASGRTEVTPTMDTEI